MSIILEETLSSKDRKELDDSMYGIVYTDENGKKVRKYPLNDEAHVLQAVRFFNKAEAKYKPHLARKIVARAKELKMDWEKWDVLKPYLDKPVKESYDPDPDSTTGTSDFDESHDDPDDCYCEQTGIPEKFKKTLEEIQTSVTSKFFPNQFDDYSSNMHFRDELKTFVKLSEPLVTKKGVPVHINSLYHLWKMAKASVDSSEYRKFIETHRDDVDKWNRQIHDWDKRIENYDRSNHKGQPLQSLKAGRENAVKMKELCIKSCDWSMNKTNVISSISGILNNGHFTESFDEMFGPVITEAFDAITGKKIDLGEPSTAEEVAAKMVDPRRVELIPIKTPPYDELYFGSPVDYSKTGIKLDRPLFVTPLKGVASMFVWCDMTIQDRIPKGSFNLNYPDLNMPDSQLMKPLKNVHMVVEGMPSLEPFGVEQTGYIHCIKTKDYEGHFYRYEWMKEWEFLIDDIDVVKFTRVIKTTVKYNIKGAPAPAGKDWGPSPSGILKFAQKIADKIHDKAEADSKEPTTNQNCLLCSWTAEANCRGEMILPRAVYSPRDPALDIKPEDIIDNCKRLSIRGFDNLLEHLQDAKDKFARWYCHVNWKDSKGGHEFLIIKVDEGKYAILDAQQGEVKPLTDHDYHFRDINWDNSYICRIDNKRFNFTKFERINNATPTPWDPKKDIPYMLREGLITKEEAETELKRAETNEFYKVLKEKLGQTPIQEGAWNDIRNGVNPWSKKRVFHITQQGHLDGQIFNPRVPEYLDKYDPSKDKFEDVDNPRVCFSPSIEGALNAIMVTIGRWKTADKLRDWYVYIPEKPIDQYKHKTTKELVKEKKVYDANVTNEVWIEEPVRLKQYGIIRVDQVSDKHIKKTVPTTTGFQGHRYRYDFKYHWVVKPKVIADVPYDYTPMGVCKDMVDEGYNFKYGLGANGSVHKASPEEYDKNYRLESPEEFEKNGGGICFDFVEWQAGYLEAYGYTCKKYFISTETDDNMTHTFILVDDGNGGFIYPEISFELLQGVHEVKSPEEAIRMIIEKIIEYHKTESIKYYVWEYSDHPPYGSNMDTCLKYFTKGEPFHEGTLNKPEKIK